MATGFSTAALIAWVLAALYYFYQYALRSAPSVMMPQLSEAFGVDALGMASIAGMFYYGYSPFSLVAGAAIDRFGARKVIPIGAALVGAGSLAFSSGDAVVASIGRFLQGAGGVFALVGAIYIATTRFPAAYAASLIGATQMFGMAGGTAGQFVVGPIIDGGLPWNRFWFLAGLAGFAISVVLFLLLPKEEGRQSDDGGFPAVIAGLRVVFSNPQSILCGIIAGLLFVPTTIFDMTWGVQFLQQGRGREFEDAVRIAASVPFGWMIGSPLLGYVSDRIGRRKPVILGGTFVLMCVMAWALFATGDRIFSGAAVGIVMGIASGAAMLPTTVIKEANPPHLGGTATGVVTFINFTFSALLGPVFGRLMIGATPIDGKMTLEHYQATFAPMLAGLLVAMVLAVFLRETGSAARSASPAKHG